MAGNEVEVRIWVPDGRRVELLLGSVRRQMMRQGDYAVTALPPGTDYGVLLDGEGPYPDPRSKWQPFGVHGPTRAFDPTDFDWGPDDFRGIHVAGEPIYELHVGTFTPEGTLDSALTKLDHLAQLGIALVELMPLAGYAGSRGWGYDGVDLYAVHESYGGPAALQRFVKAAHARGIGVCLDVVYNHVGSDGNYLSKFAPYFASEGTSWGDGFNFDGPGSRGVRDFVLHNALHWLRDFRIDALRLDAVHAITDKSQTHILAEMASAVAALAHETGREIALIAESDLNDVNVVTPLSEGGLGINLQWSDDVHHAMHAFFTGERSRAYLDHAATGALTQSIQSGFVLDGGWSHSRQMNLGAPVPSDFDLSRFIAFTQNHDQIGNRPLGDRPITTIGAGAAAGEAALVLLGPFTPMIFQGEEWGTQTPFLFFGEYAPEVVPLVIEGRAREFLHHGWPEIYGFQPDPPDPSAQTTFESSLLDWSELEDPAARRMLTWYRELLRLRRSTFEHFGNTRAVCTEDFDWFRMDHGPLTVLVAPFDRGTTAPIDFASGLVMSWGEVTLMQHQADAAAQLGPKSVAILRR